MAVIDADGFTVVVRSRRMKMARQKIDKCPCPNFAVVLSLEKRRAQISSVLCDIRSSSALEKVSQAVSVSNTMKRPVELVCLGIGSTASSQISRIQYAFALALIESLSPSETKIFDPQMDDEDARLASEDSMIVLDTNEKGKFKVLSGVFTVFFMPHCPLGLYENLLATNFNMDSLSQMLVVGNSFQDYSIRIFRRQLKAKAPHLSALLETTSSQLLKTEPEYMNAFAGMSVHSWTTTSLEAARKSLSLFTTALIPSTLVDEELL